jgi:hypothetical protein
MELHTIPKRAYQEYSEGDMAHSVARMPPPQKKYIYKKIVLKLFEQTIYVAKITTFDI